MNILPFTAPEISLESAGGKGLNLARLARAGFPVPPGFIITTGAYRAFVGANNLGDAILATIDPLAADDTTALELASRKIRAAFSAGKIPEDIAASIRQAYADLDQPSVAVRSSATAEDLPDLSFAGQQDTFLNVVGEREVLQAVVDCWSSLWTGRGIGYRLRNGIAQGESALAVVIQGMVQSESSGVLFTANPLTGLRSESVIDATLGLGEALVSGQVEPDHYVVNPLSGEILSKRLGAKSLSVRGRSGGGTETVAEAAAARQALSGEQIHQVTALGRAVQQEYGSPQDIEWAFAQGGLHLLQSRAITSLFPLPENSTDRMAIWFSFGAVQGVLGPLTPLGSDTFRCIFAGGARMFHVHVRYDEQRVLVPAGERLWIKVSDAMRHPLGSRVFGPLLGVIEPSIRQILRGLASEPELGMGSGKFRPTTALRILRFALPILARMVRNVHNPEKARADFDRLIDRELSASRFEPTGDPYDRLAQRLDFMQARMDQAFPVMLPRFIPLFGPTVGMLSLLTHMDPNRSASNHGFSTLVLEVTRGLPDNVTTEMDLALWEAARAIRADKASLAVFSQDGASELASRYLDWSLPEVAQRAVAAFMDRYGMRAVAEIDIGLPRWRENPTPIMQNLQSYLQISDEAAPDVLFARGAAAAEKAIEELATQARTQGGRLRERVVRFAARRVRVLAGVREAPKFYAVRMIGLAREGLLASGADFVAEGIFVQPDDLFLLHLSELEALAREKPGPVAQSTGGPGAPAAAPGAKVNWGSLVAERRAIFAREGRRRQIPRVLVSDGRTFYEGLGADAGAGDVIVGSPVSPGMVEGVVHVVLDPHRSQLAPGEILVCPGTDPAWTPLFMAAGGLITEVGGMMTHGSVVAREYGIPAVVGVHQATTRLKDGQKIRLDGTTGKILLIE
jgi:pyruvate,water dikinase